jgi:DNA polymerase-3 subunit delta'
LIRDPEAQAQRRKVLAIPRSASSVARAVIAAGELDAIAKARADDVVRRREEQDRAKLLADLGEDPGKRASAFARARLKEFDSESAKRKRRGQADTLDRALVDLLAFYRDVLAVQLGARVDLINSAEADLVAEQARTSTEEQTAARLDAIGQARQRLAANAAPALALEAMAVTLALPQLGLNQRANRLSDVKR